MTIATTPSKAAAPCKGPSASTPVTPVQLPKSSPGSSMAASPWSSPAEATPLSQGVTNLKKKVAARKPRWVPSREQLDTLQRYWDEQKYPSSQETATIATDLLKGSVTATQVHRWFKHKREYMAKKGEFTCKESAEKFTKEQVSQLEGEFSRNPYPSRIEREEIAGRIEASADRVRNWFNARRVSLATNGEFELKTRTAKPSYSDKELQVLKEAFSKNNNPDSSEVAAIVKEIYPDAADTTVTQHSKKVARWFAMERIQQHADTNSPSAHGKTPSPPQSVPAPRRKGGSKSTSTKKNLKLDMSSMTEEQAELHAAALAITTPTSTNRKKSTKRPLLEATPKAKAVKKVKLEVDVPASPFPTTNGTPNSVALTLPPITPRLTPGVAMAWTPNKKLEERDAHGFTPLLAAVSRNDVQEVTRLVQEGSDVNACDPKTGSTALMMAAALGHTLMIPSLIASGRCDVDMRNKQGTNALRLAAHWKHYGAVQMLLHFGCNPNSANDAGISCLHTACSDGDLNLVHLLLKAGSECNIHDGEQRTPLMAASCAGRIDVVRALVDRGAKVNHKDKYGQTALMFASKHGHEIVVSFLLREGASATLTDGDGKSAAELAKKNGHDNVYNMLQSKDDAAKNALNLLAQLC